jgi:toxin ParE1/3/4
MLPSARRNLLEIFDYIATQSGYPERARRFTASLEAHCAKLASLPGVLGVERPELRPDIRSFPFRRYVIFFRYVDDVFEVVSILEGHRDIARYFEDDAEDEE